MKKSVLALIGLVIMLAASLARAEMTAPDELIRQTVDEVLAVVHQDKDIQAGDKKKILALVEEKVFPHFDFERMTRLAVGKNWRKATPEQKKQLVDEFRNLLVRTYTSAFTRFENQSVKIMPLRMRPGDDEATVRTQIIKAGSQPVAVDYEMEKKDDGWKAFDLSVEGASLVTTYRGTFTEEIDKNGIDGLIKTLVDKNREAGEKPINKVEAK